MSRTCIEWPLNAFIRDNRESFQGLPIINVSLYIDSKSAEEIIDFIESEDNRIRFIRILLHILQNQYNDDLYRKESHNQKTRNITAMKFKGSGKNTRIYCQERFPGVTGGGKKIVMIHFLENKGKQKNDKKIKDKLEAIADYEYIF